MKLFHYLHYGLAAVLVFVGGKMLLAGFYKIPTLASLLHAARQPKETKAAAAAATNPAHATAD